MGGGLMQLVAYGAQDIYLTGNPQITFFKVVYRRHTNFSMETIQQTINGASSSSTSAQSGTVTISRNGDLVSKIWVRCDQDAVDGVAGDHIISEVELEIGGQRIDKHTREWLQVWAELTTPASKSEGYKYLTSGFTNTNITQASTNQKSVMVPLQFWFCRNPGLALPLIALQYHEVKVKFTWGLTTEIAKNNGTITTSPTYEVWVDYIYLDTDERRRFAQVSHEYLIEQLQVQSEGSSKADFKLNFNHPVKELIWTDADTVKTETTKLVLNGHDRFAAQTREYFQLRQPLEYHTTVPGYNIKEKDHPTHVEPVETGVKTHHATDASALSVVILEATRMTVSAELHAANPFLPADNLSIAVGGHDASDHGADAVTQHHVTVASVSSDPDPVLTFKTAINAEHLHSALANGDGVSVHILSRNIGIHRSNCSQLATNVNVYSFALKPEEHQPSGSCNFSRIDNATLTLSTAAILGNIYAVNYNVLRIMSGMGGLAYSN